MLTHRAHTEFMCLHTCTWRHTESPGTHTHRAHVLSHTHMEACMEPMHSNTHRHTWRHARSPHAHMHTQAPPVRLAASRQLEARTLPSFLPGPQQQELKDGAPRRSPDARSHLRHLESTVARFSEELAVFLETLTRGHFPIVLLQLNGQREGRPLGCVHHLWTQNHDPCGLCCREQSTRVCVGGWGGGSGSASAPHTP